MKWLQKLRLINWHFFDDASLEFGRQTMITGRNSAGKSTIIDALQMLFIANQQQIRFNVAAMQEAKRTLLGYLRGKMGRDDKTYLRDGDFSSYIVAEFYDRIKQETFVAGVMFDVYRDDQIAEEYFILADTALDDLDFIKGSGHLMNREEFRKSQGGSRGRAIFERNKSAYQKALLNRLGQIHERFTRVFPKALAFKPIENVREFVCSFILDEENLQLDMMRQTFEVYEKYRQELAELEVRQGKLADIAKHHEMFMKWRDIGAEQEYVIRRLRYLEQLEIRDRQAGEKRNLDVRLQTATGQLTLLEEKQQEAGEKSREAYYKWQTHEITRRRVELREQLKQGERELAEKMRLTADFSAAVTVEADLLEELTRQQADGYWTWQAGDRKKLTEIWDLLAGLPPDGQRSDLILLRQSLVEAGAWLDFFCADLRKSGWTLETELEEVRRRQAVLETEIRDLLQKKRTYPPAMEKLKALLEERLAGRSPVWVLCEEMEFVCEDWRNAVEGFLNTQRFDLLVEPALFEEALRLYEQEKWKHTIENVGLVDTEKERKCLGSSHSGSLSGVLSTKNPIVQARIDHLLGMVMQATDEQELRLHHNALTQSCMSYQNLVARQIPRSRYEIPYIGAQAIVRQLEIKQREMAEVVAVGELLSTEKQKITTWLGRLGDRKGLYAAFADKAGLRLETNELRVRQEGLAAELEGLDLHEVERLQADYDFWQAQLVVLQSELKTAIEEKTKISSRLGLLETELYLQEKRVDEKETEWLAWAGEFPFASIAGAQERLREAEKQTFAFSERISRWESNQKGNRTRRDDEFQALRDRRHEFNLMYHHTVDIGQEDNGYYHNLLDKLAGVDIPAYQIKLADSLRQSEEEFKSHFIYKMREAIESARRDFAQLNHTLKNFPYSDDHYRFDIKASEKYRSYYEVIMDPQVAERGSLFEAEQPDGEKVRQLRELFDKLIHGDPAEQEEFTDYRRYLDFDIIVKDGNGAQYTFSKVLREKSGGETQTPFYIAILASFQQLYSDKSARLVVFDEAFNKMDEERILTSIRLIKRMNLQLIAVVPDEKMQHLAPEVTTTILVHREGAHAFVDMIGRTEAKEMQVDGGTLPTGGNVPKQDSMFTAG